VRSHSFLAPLLACCLALMGCHSARHERATVAVSIFPLYDLVRRTAGPDADVVLVLPPGESSQGWTPGPDVASKIAKASLLVAVGLGVDPWMDVLLPHAAPRARILKLGDRVPTITSDDGAIDGYVWMDPQRARLMATAIGEDLARADSSHALAFRDRAGVVDASLAALDKEIESRTASWTKRDTVALPPSMAYYAERYGLHVRRPGGAESASASDPLVDPFGLDPLGGARAPGGTNETYEELIRADTAALDSSLR
jgi:zinc transport system substrate-binding protein